MWLGLPLVLVARRVVDHAHVGHPPLGTLATRPLLPNARCIQTHVRASFAAGVPLPLQRCRIAKRLTLFEQSLKPITRVFGHTLDSRFAYLQSTQLPERHFAGLREAGLKAHDTH